MDTLEQLSQATNETIKNQDHAKIVELLSKIIIQDINNVEAFYNRGTAYFELKQFEQAIQDFNKAIELNPNDAEAYYTVTLLMLS